jgi:hypothetical protein
VLLGVILVAMPGGAENAWWIATAMRFGGFWAAILEYRAIREEAPDDWRFVLGLLLGAVLAHLGWAVLSPAPSPRSLERVLDWQTGFASVFVLLGPVLTAPGRRHGDRRRRYLSGALLSLPLALATARLGCIAEGCCNGVLLPAPLAPLLDVGLLSTLRWAALRVDSPARPHALVIGLVAINSVNHLLRRSPGETSSEVAIAAAAVAWLGLLLVWPKVPDARSQLDVRRGLLP